MSEFMCLKYTEDAEISPLQFTQLINNNINKLMSKEADNKAEHVELRQVQSHNRFHPEEVGSKVKVAASSKHILSNVSTTNVRRDLPGPASYSVASMFDNKKGFTVPHAEVDSASKPQQKPTPWSYSPKQLNFKTLSPRVVIGTQKKSQKLAKLPGPADYKANFKLLYRSTRRPIFGTQRRGNLTELKISPGPTDYNTKKGVQLSHSNRGVVIGTQQRQAVNGNRSPSPNQYAVAGNFETNVKLKKGFSIGKRLHIKTEVDYPGEYLRYELKDLTLTKTKAPAFTIQKSEKLINFDTISPGPAAYLTPSVRLDRGPIMFRASRSPRESYATPGPLDYEIPPLRQSPSFSIPKGLAIEKKQNKFPGPANYNPAKPQSQRFKAMSMGQKTKNNTISYDITPAPGKYNIEVPKQRGFTIKKQARNHESSKKEGPGPAAYNIDFSAIKKHISVKKV